MLTAEQKQLRAKGIGASESPAILGVDPYRSPLDVYLRKLGLVEDVETHHTERGTFLEPALREWANARLGVRFVASQSLVHPERPHVLATPDGVLADGNRVAAVLELKSPGPRTWHEWGDAEDGVPDRYVVQVAQQMAVTGAEVAHVAALIDGDLRLYKIRRDRELEAFLLDTVERFWREHVEAMTPPEVDGSETAREWLHAKFPRDTAPLRTASDAEAELLSEYGNLKAAAKRLDGELELVEQRLKSIIGEAGGLEAPHVGKVTWKSTKGRTSIDWAAMAKHLGATEQHEAQFLRTGQGHRTMRFYPAKEK